MWPLKHHTAGDAAGRLWLKQKPPHNGEMLWWAVSLPTYQPPGHAVLGKASYCLNSRLDFDTPFSGWFLLQGRRKDVQMQLVMPFMPFLGRKCSACAVSYCLYLFYKSTDFTLLEGISWKIHSWCSLSWFVCSRIFFFWKHGPHACGMLVNLACPIYSMLQIPGLQSQW